MTPLLLEQEIRCFPAADADHKLSPLVPSSSSGWELFSDKCQQLITAFAVEEVLLKVAPTSLDQSYIQGRGWMFVRE